MTGCHVAAHDWATWHLYQQTKIGHLSFSDWPTCLPHQLSRHIPYCHVVGHTATCHPVCLPRQPATSPDDITHAMCHPSNGDTCHLRIRPTVPHTLNPPATCHSLELPCVSVHNCHVSLYRPATCRILKPPCQL
jgi:hypothetical protein